MPNSNAAEAAKQAAGRRNAAKGKKNDVQQ
jgi:hypothetical protein